MFFYFIKNFKSLNIFYQDALKNVENEISSINEDLDKNKKSQKKNSK